MRFVLCLVGCLVLANIFASTFLWPPVDRATTPPASVDNWATKQGLDPWMSNERYNAPNRERTRKGILEVLDRPWSTYCTIEGRERLVRSIDNYFWQREAQAWSYGNTYGEEARRYAIDAWKTADDNRILRLVNETFGRGYFSVDELRPYARAALLGLLKDVHVNTKPCDS